MKAFVYTAPGKAEVSEIPDPVIAPTECLVKPLMVGICHSDFDLLDGNYILPFDYPVTPGHEWMGEITEVGSRVSGFEVGDRVVGECSVADDQHFGFTIDGAMSELMKVESAWLHKVPEGMSDTVAALIEPFTVAYGATDKIDASDDVVVFGAGPIGLCAVVSASGKGGRVILVEPDAQRRELGKSLGASETIDPLNADVVAEVMRLTGGRGATRVIEATGRPAVMAQTLEVACYGGYITNIGINVGDKGEALLGLIVEKNLSIRGQVGSVGVWPEAIRFLGRQDVDLSQIVSKVFPLEEARDALDASAARDKNIKIHVRPQG
jgi:threonine dehydrogenase-like Zn-dependent dehydrogenase